MAEQMTLTILRDPADATAAAEPVSWAIGELRRALEERGIAVDERAWDASASGPRVIAAGRGSEAARAGGGALPEEPEALALVPTGSDATLAVGADIRGLVYALLELADRVQHAEDALAALRVAQPVVERAANPIRSVARLFTSDVEDKGWWRDRAFWRAYLTEMATQRFSRFNMTLGLGYNFPRDVPDAYFYFAYPFLLAVPGYDVRATDLPDEERDANLETLRFVGEETVRRGLHFQLAIWTHAYEWIDTPKTNHRIEGLTPENHADYSREAVRLLLQRVPTISGVTFRVHGESGVPEGSYDFWQAVFEGVATCGRRVEIDMHSKGLDQRTIDLALATGQPVLVSGKYWAEHMGLPYQQAQARDLERLTREPTGQNQGHMALSGGNRRFTRYGYGDFLREDRRYGFIQRIWPGTQRLLLWGDPAMAAGYGRYAHFAGQLGAELCEPLSFKGRMGSGRPGGRHGYADPALAPAEGWEKYRYTYRLIGRLLYNPDADADTWRRYTRARFGPAADAMEAALANASRVLLLVTTAYHPSASNNRYWPEIYTNMPIVSDEREHPYNDTPSPKRLGTVSPLDPALFTGVDEFADEVTRGTRSGRYSPLDMARWLDGFAGAAADHLAEGRRRIGSAGDAEFRRWAADVAIQASLGRFFANLLRAGVGYALHQRTGELDYLREAVACYRDARAAMAEAADQGGVYRDDLTFGREPWLRGHWQDRLPAIDADLADMTSELDRVGGDGATEGAERLAALAAERRPPQYEHRPPASFQPGEPVTLEIAAEAAAARLFYRHVNQAEAYERTEMAENNGRFQATIPGSYTTSPYPLQYFFELADRSGTTCLVPALAPDLSNQPYYFISSRGGEGRS